MLERVRILAFSKLANCNAAYSLVLTCACALTCHCEVNCVKLELQHARTAIEDAVV